MIRVVYLCGVVWCGVAWCGVVRCGVAWCGAVWCGAVWCGVVRCGVVRCGVVWCGVVWCGESFIFSESNLRSTLLHTDSPSKLLPTTSLLPLSFSFSLTPPHHHLPHTDHPPLLSLKPSFPALPPKPTPSPFLLQVSFFAPPTTIDLYWLVSWQ